MSRKIIAYRLEPVYEMEPGSIATAALMTCMVTGECLSGMGGGGEYISPEIYENLKGRLSRLIKAANAMAYAASLPPRESEKYDIASEELFQASVAFGNHFLT